MEPNLNIKPGTVVQINPESYPEVGGDFLVVKDVYEWGVQGYLANVFPTELTRFKGIAYLRPKWEDIELVGIVHWKIDQEVEDENQ